MDKTIEILKKGRRVYGELTTFEDGRKVYLARRKHAEIYRGGEASVSDALRKHVASWAYDVETLDLLKCRSVDFIGVRVVDTGETYIMPATMALDKSIGSYLNYAGRGGAHQKYIPLHLFHHKPGKIKL